MGDARRCAHSFAGGRRRPRFLNCWKESGRERIRGDVYDMDVSEASEGA
ncbi:MAG: hypothetical protein QXP58_05310 [Thermoprotei archaeon]